MGTLKFGISGPFSGKVGSVVGCTWKGIPYMRSLPKKRSSKPSSAELANRERFALAQAWLKPLLPFVRIGFKGYSATVEGFVAAKSYLLKNAIEGEYPDFYINSGKMKLSYGNLPNTENAVVVYNSDLNQIIFTWNNQTPNGASPQDQVMLMAYFAKMGEACYITTGVFRKAGVDEIQLPSNIQGESADVYMSFIAADRSRQSDSVYLGSIFCG